MRTLILTLVVLGLVAAVWLLWPDSADEETPVTAALATTTAPTEPDPSSTTAPESPSTSTTAPEPHVVETVEEAEEILRELWFGWFEGIYNQDEDRIREVVANPAVLEAAIEQFGRMDFTVAPDPSRIVISDAEILRADESCLAIWAFVDATSMVGETNDGVHVFLYNDRWLFISQWANRGDLWESDCEAQL